MNGATVTWTTRVDAMNGNDSTNRVHWHDAVVLCAQSRCNVLSAVKSSHEECRRNFSKKIDGISSVNVQQIAGM